MAAPTSPNGDYIYQGANNSYYNLNNTSLDPSNNPDNAVGTLFTCHVGAKSSRSLSLSLDSVFTLSNPPVLATPSYLISLLKPSHAHESRWYRYGTMCELSRFMITRKVAIVSNSRIRIRIHAYVHIYIYIYIYILPGTAVCVIPLGIYTCLF